MQPNIVGIRLNRVGKIYHFDASPIPDLKVGDHVIVETSRGQQLGEIVTTSIEKASPPHDGKWKAVERRATPRDLLLKQTWQAKQDEAKSYVSEQAGKLNLPVKIIAAEYSFDGKRLNLMYSTESDEKVELKSLRKHLQKKFGNTYIDLRQIGPRDVAKLIGGMGACGLETRCCTKFLTDFSPISIKMAKEQGISLTPSEITGMCGRLRCCLLYEYQQYVDARKSLPKRNKRVVTPSGEGKVIDVLPLSDSVVVMLDGESKRSNARTYTREEIEPWDELEALRRKSEGGCANGGECSCGKN